MFSNNKNSSRVNQLSNTLIKSLMFDQLSVTFCRWVTSEWMKCPDNICSLGERFTQKRWTFCVRENPSSEMRWQRVMDNFCSDQPQPQLERPCDTSNCTERGYWKTGVFTRVSHSKKPQPYVSSTINHRAEY